MRDWRQRLLGEFGFPCLTVSLYHRPRLYIRPIMGRSTKTTLIQISLIHIWQIYREMSLKVTYLWGLNPFSTSLYGHLFKSKTQVPTVANAYSGAMDPSLHILRMVACYPNSNCNPNPNFGRLFHKMCDLYLFCYNDQFGVPCEALASTVQKG